MAFYHQEHGELPEPIIYGNGGNAVQPLCEMVDALPASKAGMMCRTLDDGKVYNSVRETARAMRVSESRLRRALKKGHGRAEVDGRKVIRIYR